MKLANRSKSLVMALALVASLFAVGGAAAATETLDDSTYTVTNDTQSIYAEVTGTSNISSTGTATADVTYYGVNSDGVATQVATSTVTVENGTTTLDEYTSLNTSKYDEYRVTVEGNASKLDVETGTISKAAGGGSILGLDSSLTEWIPGDPLYLGAGVVAVVAVLAIVRD
jgi:hypothetical protein